ncbi:uncharacterized protein L3040_000884 [Drepanopeziza brunnea f. sp. 'multigermtubi']|uniref:uncharacterized protein n=1 Tax=Drepanopeziza brunnea f. sp. 'multigermtubi' TaxID=698441 RepID=UPI00239E86A5|nr:hypothetical protein L3040_000884 [Drepanopeziza brunnea f. sp. 'multigermtubi']
MNPTQALEAAMKKIWQTSDDREKPRSTARAGRRDMNDREPPTMEGIAQYIATLRQEVKNKRASPESSDERPPYKKNRTQKSEDQVHEPSPKHSDNIPRRSHVRPGERAVSTGIDRGRAIVGRKDNSKVMIIIRKEANDPIRGWTPVPEEKFEYKHEISDWKDKGQILKLNKWRAAIFHKYFAPLKIHVWLDSEKLLVQALLREGLEDPEAVLEAYHSRMTAVQRAGERTIKGLPLFLKEDRIPPRRTLGSIKEIIKLCKTEEKGAVSQTRPTK